MLKWERNRIKSGIKNSTNQQTSSVIDKIQTRKRRKTYCFLWRDAGNDVEEREREGERE